MKHLVRKIDRSMNWQWLQTIVDYTIQQGIAIQQIPAPTFHEADRAAYIQQQFTQAGLEQVSTDDMHNVYGLLPGQRPDLPAIMVAAHTDTVFPAQTDLTLRDEGEIIHGPGLGDNSFGAGALLGVIQAIRQQRFVLERDVWLVATTREEGLGDLGGMKAAYERLQNRVNSVINLEGLAFGHIYHAGISVRRLHIVATAPGGHSWLHFGRPSATHGIIQLGAQIMTIEPPENPRTTYNIGLIEGGQGINVIATQAGLWLDMRSEDQAALADLERQVMAHINALTTPELKFTVTVVGDRPSGQIPIDHELVEAAITALAQVGVQGMLETGSTDANIPLAAGCAAITIGITRGGNAHRLDEYVELQPVALGLRQLTLLVLAAGGYQMPT